MDNIVPDNGKHKPSFLKPLPENIPTELKAEPHWLNWQSELTDKGKPTKVPYVPSGNRKASTTDSKTYSRFHQVIDALLRGRFDGIGKVLQDNETGIDLDKCRNPETGELKKWAADIIAEINSYSEISPSGTGIRIVCYGVPVKQTRWRRDYEDGVFEMYNKFSPRYVSLTGHHLPGTPKTMEWRTDQVAALYARVFPPVVKPESTNHTAGNILEYADLIQLASAAENGNKFSKLWAGDLSDYENDWSAADLALCNLLAFWTRKDPTAMDEIFRQSGLMRDKWEQREDYRTRTITKAIESTTNVYQGDDAGPSEAELAAVFGVQLEEVQQPLPQIDLEPYKRDERTAYLWHENHGRYVSEEGRQKRIKSILDVWNLIPKTGLIPEFIKYGLPTTDAPPIFHLAAGLSMAGHLLNRKVWLNTGNERLHPLLWICLLAASSKFRKSTAIKIVRRFLERDELFRETLLPNTFSIEGLYAELGFTDIQPNGLADVRRNCRQQEQDNPNYLTGVGMFHVDELAEFLQALDNSTNKGSGKPILTSWYDCPAEFIKASRGAGLYYIYKPHVSILGASTVDWLSRNCTEGDLLGGFLPRWLFFKSGDSDYLLSFQDEPCDHQRKLVEAGMATLKLQKGERRLSEDARDYYDGWLKEFVFTTHPMMGGWCNRLGTYALKIALLYECTVGGSEVVSVENMQLACALITKIKHDLAELLDQDIAFTDDGRIIQKILRALRNAGGRLTKSGLYKAVRIPKKAMDGYLDTLIDSGLVRWEEEKGATKKTMWVVLR